MGWDAVLGTAVPQSLSLHPQHHHHAVLQHQNPVWARPARSNNPAGRGEGNPPPPSPKVHLLDKSFLSTAFIEKLSCAGQLPSPAWDRGTGTARRVLNIHSVRGFPFAGLALGPQHRWDAGRVPPPCPAPPPLWVAVPGVGEEQRETRTDGGGGGGGFSTRSFGRIQRRPHGAPRCHPPHRQGPAGLRCPVLPSSSVGCAGSSCRPGVGARRVFWGPHNGRPSPSEERPRPFTPPPPRAASHPARGP